MNTAIEIISWLFYTIAAAIVFTALADGIKRIRK